VCIYIYTEWPKNIYTLFTHQYLWNKSVPGSNTSRLLPTGSLKDDVYRRKPATLDDLRENIAMSCAAITLDTLQNIVHAAVRRLRQCLDADGGHFEHLYWIQNSRTSLISILLFNKYSSYDNRVIFFMSNCVYILLGHSVDKLIMPKHIFRLYRCPSKCRNAMYVGTQFFAWHNYELQDNIFFSDLPNEAIHLCTARLDFTLLTSHEGP
jgi:hypothetical protein